MGFPSSLLLACFPKGKTAYGELFDLFWQSAETRLSIASAKALLPPHKCGGFHDQFGQSPFRVNGGFHHRLLVFQQALGIHPLEKKRSPA